MLAFIRVEQQTGSALPNFTKMIQRTLQQSLVDLKNNFPVILITGPRQIGAYKSKTPIHIVRLLNAGGLQ